MNINILKDTTSVVILLALFIVQLPATILASYLLAAIFILVRVNKIILKPNQIIISAIILLVLFLPTLTFNHKTTPIVYLVASPFLFLMAYDLSNNSLNHLEAVLRNSYWFFILFILSAFMLHREAPEPLGAILPWASTNGIPSYLITLQAAYSLSYYTKNNRMPILSSTITLVVAILGLGRGSIIIGFAILASSFFINIFILKLKKDRLIALKMLVLGAGPALFFIADNTGDVITSAIEKSRFSTGVFDEHRGRMLSDYINKIDGVNLLLGASYEHTSIDTIYGGNPHNSYIRAHSFYGIFGIIIVLIPLVAIWISKKESTQKFVFSLFILLVLLRAVSEPIFFPSTLDFFYFLYFAIFFRHSKDQQS